MITPILSICIPTYNRAGYLRDTLESILSQDGIDEIEIVISDNCSVDTTREVAEAFVRRYPGTVTYSRNEKNILDANFAKALLLGTGQFLKLHNDTAVLCDGAIRKMVAAVKRARERNALPFFMNGNGGGAPECFAEDLSAFISATKYWNTWIAAFGIWREMTDEAVRIMREKSPTQLSQSWALLSLIRKGTSVLINDETLFRVVSVARKGGYNIAEVFGRNYNEVLRFFYREEALSRRVYNTAKRDILKFVNCYYFDLNREFQFQKTGYFKWVFPFYWSKIYFYAMLFRICRVMYISGSRRCADGCGR